MAKVTLNDGTVIYDGATPGRGTAWTGVASVNLFDTTAHSAAEYFSAALSPELAAQLAAGTAGFTLVSATLTGASQVSMFDGMTVSGVNGLISDLVFPTGIFLSSGFSSVPLYNTSTGYSQSTGGSGDGDVLTTVTTAFPGKATSTNDAAGLEAVIFVTNPDTTSFTFDVVFGSEEFPEYSNSFVDGAVVMIDGVNYALFNGAATPLSVTDANVAGGYFYNNTGSTTTQGGVPLPGVQMVLPVEYDGISQTLRITAQLGAGTATTIGGKSGTLHTIKIAIADTNDHSLDSGIWIGNISLGSGDGLGVVINFDESPAARDFFTNPAVLVSGSPDATAFIAKYGQQTYEILIANAPGNQKITDAAGSNSSIFGYGGNDTLNGVDGNDTLHGNAGNDFINGGSGDDTATFSGPRARYTITYDSETDRVIVKDSLAGGDGTDSVGPDVEHLSFSDGVHDLDEFKPQLSAATITAFGPVNYATLEFSDVLPNAYRTDLYDNVNMTVNGVAYADALAISWMKGGSLFQTYLTGDNLVYSGGGGFSGDSTGTLTAGTVTGYFLTVWNGTAYQPYLSIQGISIAAVSFWQALLSSATTDDLALLQSILQGPTTVFASTGDDSLSGGPGTDTISYAQALGAVSVRLGVAGVQNTGGAGVDTLSGFENLSGSAFNDALTGDANANTLDGGAGNDTLDGGAGTDTAAYGNAASAVTVRLAVAGAQNTGGSGSDTLVGIENLTGSGFNDTLAGNGGANALSGGAGNDTLDGGAGNDTLDGGIGTDTAAYGTAASAVTVRLALTGAQNTVGAGSDTLVGIENLIGSSFNDVLTGDGNANALSGGAGNDTLEGGAGNDTLDGGAGTDTAAYGTAASAVTVRLAVAGAQNTGGSGSDTLVGVENLAGSGFNDMLSGDGNANTLSGGAGNDTLDGGAGNDTLDGGPGTDTAAYGTAAAAVTVRLAVAGAQNTIGAGSDTLVGIENLTGSGFNDALSGDGNANTLSGGAGNDTLDGGAGNDTLDGGIGTDTAAYGTAASAVTVRLAVAGAQNTIGAGSDTLVGIENLTGSGFNDTLAGNGIANTLSGGAGNDTLDGGAGNDTLDGGVGTDTAAYGTAASAVTVRLAVVGVQNTVGAGSDTLVGIENLSGSAFNDTLAGNGVANTLSGGAGNDTLDGGAGNDTLDGGTGTDTAAYGTATSAVTVRLAVAGAQNTVGAGSDTLIGIENLTGSGFNDMLAGNGGANTLSGGAGNDTLDGGAGNDTLDGGTGTDTAAYGTAASAVTVRLAVAGAQNTVGAGSDTLVGIENLTGSGFNDTLAGNGIANTLSGGAGNDTLDGGAGNDTLDGGAGIDMAAYSSAASAVTVSLAVAGAQNTGGAGSDTLVGIERLTGSDFNDILTGDGNANTLNGGAGNDTLNGGAGGDTLDGGAGIDTATYALASSAVTLSLAVAGGQETGGAGTDTLVEIENLTGSSFDDALTGNGSANALSGGAGNDTLEGGAGNDVLDGGAGTDTATYGLASSAVTASLAVAGSQNTVGAGSDTLVSIENLTGSAFNDTLTGSGGVNALRGDAGNDTLQGGAGGDTLDGGSGTDTASYLNSGGVIASLADSSINTGDASGDTYVSIENIIGSNSLDILYGNAGANRLTGNAGNDVLVGGAGADALDGGADFNSASYSTAITGVTASLANSAANTGDAAGDTYSNIEGLIGSSHDDTLIGDSHNNELVGGQGADRLNGGLGYDTAVYVNALAAVTASLLNPASNTGEAAGDTYVSIEAIVGSRFNDVLTGDAGGNDLRGFDGNDTLIGGVGDDFMIGGSGNDTLDGGPGDDTMQGGDGIDTATYGSATAAVIVSLAVASAQNTGGAGSDTLSEIENLTGSAFNDTLTGDGNANRLSGGAGNDTLNGGAGNDTLDGGAAIDTATYATATSAVTVSLAVVGAQNTGGAGSDTLVGIENLTGSSFNDALTGAGNANALSGGAGNDTLDGGAGNDTLNGGAGIDTATYGSATAAVTVRLAVGGAQNTGGAGNDTLVGIENLTGSAFNDTLTGDGNANALSGGAGNDTLDGGAGNDTLDGGAGIDLAAYAAATAAVTVSLAVAGAQNTGGAGTDTLVGIENLAGSSFGDTLTGTAAANRLSGNDGDDTLIGGAGADILDGGNGNDFASYINASAAVVASLANPSLNTGDAAGDTYISIERLAGSAFNDTLSGDSSNNSLRGGLGADTLDGGAGSDTASYTAATAGLTVSLADTSANTGEAAGDVFISIENISGSRFDDTLIGDSGNNTLLGNGGGDVLNGGAGTDTASYQNATSAVKASLASPSGNTGEAAGDSYISIENLTGTSFNDTLTGDSHNNFLVGGTGADVLDGGAGADYAGYTSATSGVRASLANPSINTGDAAGDTYVSIERLAGSAFNDTLIGDSKDNSLRGNGGADTLDGGAGFDYASYFNATTGVTASLANAIVNTGEAAGDSYISIEGLSGSAFNDVLIGDAGDNWLVGQGGGDVLNGGAGSSDYASYGDATSGVIASLANSSINTGEAAGDTYISIESLAGSAFNDVLIGDNNSNVLRGQAGADILIGGGGSDAASYKNAASGVTASLSNPATNTGDAAGDTYSSIEELHGSDFADNLTGNSGNNSLRGNDGADRLDGGGGFDYADYNYAATGVTASLANPSANTGYAAGDTYISIYGLSGSAFDDVLTGDAGNNGFQGRGGADRLDGGAGFDAAFYADSTVGLTVSLANPSINTGVAAGDTFISIEALGGSAFADVLYGDSGNNTLAGFGGDDILIGGAGADFLQGDNTTLTSDGGIDTASYVTATAGVAASLASPSGNTGDAAGDAYSFIENLTGSNFNDALTGDGGNNALTGGLGNDTLDGGGGVDTASYASATAGVTVNLSFTGAQNTGAAGTDMLTNIENLAGSSFADRLSGDSGGNVLTGGSANDILMGGAGADVLDGGSGSDIASYGNATSGVTASLLNPSTNTGDAAGDSYISIEYLSGSSFNDTLTGDARDNALFGAGGADSLDGGAGFDFASYFSAITGITASLANSRVNTGEAAGDVYTAIEGLGGSAFDDTLVGDGGNNILIGNAGADRLNGGAGIDIAGYYNATSGVTVSLANPSANTGEAAGDTYSSIEGLGGSTFNDTLTGDGGNNVLEGGLGTDVLNGGNGSDTASYLHAGSAVTVSLAVSGAQNTGAAGTDTLINIENLDGSAFGDTLTGNAAANTLTGEGGDDLLIGGAGADTLDGGTGNDYASYRNASAAVVASLAKPSVNTGEAAGDTYVSIERLEGSAFNDTLTGNAGGNSLRGGLGADRLDGGTGRDTASYFYAATGVTVSLTDPSLNTGEAAGDTFTSIENISGSAFNDTLVGDDGNNGLLGNGGADVLYGGAGFDTASYTNATSGLTISLGNPSVNTGEAAGDVYFSIENLQGTNYNDTLIGDAGGNSLLGEGGADTLDGQGGFDYASYTTAATAVMASLTVPSTNTGDAAGDVYRSIEGLTGSQFNDALTGDAGGNWLEGQGGADTLDGQAGFDYASYYSAATGITASLADRTSNTGEAAGDVYIAIEGLGGSAFNDVLVGDSGDNVLAGQRGADSLNGGAGFDTAAYFNATSGVTASLSNAASNTGEAAGDTYSSIEGLIGSSFADRLTGDGGSNTLTGGAGADTLDGGAGFDYASYSNAGAAVTAILGTPANNTGDAAGDSYANIEGVIGSSSGDVLGGNGGDNILIGNGGKDFFIGGGGNDTFYGNSTTSKFDGFNDDVDYSITLSGQTQGITVNWAAGTVTGQAGIVGTDQLIGIEGVFGTQFDDTFDATGYTTASQAAGDNASGSAPYQQIRGGGGNDTIIGNNNTEDLYTDATSGITVTLTAPGTGTVTGGGVGSDTLKGGVNRFIGSLYDDTFNGSSAQDIFDGYLGGNDVYRGGGGADQVEYDGYTGALIVNLAAGTIVGRFPGSSVGNDTLDSIEQIRGSESDDIYNATGFSGSSTNAGSVGTFNQFEGQGGADTVTGNGNTRLAYFSASGGIQVTATGTGSGTVTATYGTNTATDTYTNVLWITGSNLNDSIVGGDGGERFEGRAGNDSLSGNNGDDTLDGGAGGDLLFGGAGMDAASYASAGAGLTVSLGNTALNTGDAAGDIYNSIENLAGSNFNDVLSGDSGNNRIDGGSGDDILSGGGGTDQLVGGAGNDTFLFDQPLVAGVVTSITDFAPGADKIALSHSIFTQAGAVGPLGASAFFTGTAAHDADDRIIYNSSTGAVMYDADGNGSAAATTFATVAPGLGLSASDFKVV